MPRIPGIICMTCPFWSEATYEDGTTGEAPEFRLGICRRYAPRPSLDRVLREEDYEDDPTWPRTLSVEWCGEHPRMAAYLRRLQAARPVAVRRIVPARRKTRKD